MAKPNIRSLDKMAFTKVVPTRNQKIAEAPNKPLPPLASYKANELAKALHPACQHLIVSEVIERTPDVKSFVLVPDTENGTESLAWFSAGQYISIQLSVGGHMLTRPYSLSSSPREALLGKYMLTVKRTEGGLASHFILDSWQPGTKVTASAPLGTFTFEPLRDAKQIIGLAGGSGVTPFYSLAQAIADGDEDAELTLLYGSRTKADAVFSDEFERIAKGTPHVRLVNVLSDEPAEGCESGFITAALIQKYAPSDGEYSLFICGPQAMYDFVDREIEKLGLRKKFIRHELFGEYKHPERDADYPGAQDETFELTVRVCGEEQKVPCRADETLLVSMERAGVPAPADCRSGVCGWCHSRLIDGDVYVPKSVDGRRMADLQFGYVHPCCTFPLGNVALDVPPVRT